MEAAPLPPVVPGDNRRLPIRATVNGNRLAGAKAHRFGDWDHGRGRARRANRRDHGRLEGKRAGRRSRLPPPRGPEKPLWLPTVNEEDSIGSAHVQRLAEGQVRWGEHCR
jgi:hypothetical protein